MATFTVTNANDDGEGSLREALFDAALALGDDVIVFDASLAGQEIVLASELQIFSNAGAIVIDGDVDADGSADIVISGDTDGSGDEGDTPHLRNSGSAATIRNLTFKHGRSVPAEAFNDASAYGSIRNEGGLSLENVTFETIVSVGEDRSSASVDEARLDAATIVNLGALTLDDVFFVDSRSVGGDVTVPFSQVTGGDAVVGVLQPLGSTVLRGSLGFSQASAESGAPAPFGGGGASGDAFVGVMARGGTLSGQAAFGLDRAETSLGGFGGGGFAGTGVFRGRTRDDALTRDARLDPDLGAEADPIRTESGAAQIAFRGDHVIRGGTEADTIFGGDGADTIAGDAAADVIFGGGGDDVLRGDGGINPIADRADTIHGEGGDDTFIGGFDVDALFGGTGDDVFVILSNDRPDDAEGGDGVDTVDFSGVDSRFSFEVDLGTGAQFRTQDGFPRAERGSVVDIENIVGSPGGDTLTGDDARNALRGAGGMDRIAGGAGDDALAGGGGDDALRGDGGADRVMGGDGDDTVFGGDGDDDLRGARGADRIIGGGGDDMLFGGARADRLLGGGDDDSLNGGAGRDSLDAGRGRDDLAGGGGRDILDGGKGRDALAGGGGRDVLKGGKGRDALDGGGGRDRFVFDGNDGRDVIEDFRQGRDKIAFQRGGADRFSDLSIVDRGADVAIRYDGGVIRVVTDDADAFTARDFVF
ncbi:MAG: calcium-binding protein [Pseudomonadota bacterium]